MMICGAKVKSPPPPPGFSRSGSSFSSTGFTPSMRPAMAQVRRLSCRTARWKLITASVPASPAMDGPVVKPPLASMGISGMLMENDFPPISGTQSGMVRPRLLMPEIALLISEITTLMGVLNSAPSVSKIPPKMSFTPCQACSQLPVNTPVINVIIPSKMAFTPEIASLIPWENTEIAASTAGTTTEPMVISTVITFWMMGSTI